jgi:hypothetical protein
MNIKPVTVKVKVLVAALAALFVLSLVCSIRVNYQPGQGLADLWLSALMLTFPLGAMYFSIGLLVTAWWQRRDQGQVSERLARFINRTPPIAGALILIFVSQIAMEGFNTAYGFWEAIGGFLIQILPAILIAVVLLALAWRWPLIGFVLFLAAAIFGLSLSRDIVMLLAISGPMAGVALLFLASWKWSKVGREKKLSNAS